MKRGFNRSDRVADLIQKILAPLIISHHDKRFQFVTVTSVVVSRDLSYAKIFVSVLQDNDDEIRKTIAALNDNAKEFRYELAKKIKLRIVPELRFEYDESTARGFKLSQLIDSAIKKTDPK